MNIVLATGIYPPDIGGPATFTRALAQSLQSQKEQASIVTYGDRATLRVPAPVYVIGREGGVVVRYICYAWRVFCLAREASLVFAQGPVSEGVPAAWAAWLARKPFILKVVGDVAWETAQRQGNTQPLDMFIERPEASLKAHGVRWLERWVAKMAQRIVVPSRYLRSVVERWGVPKERIEVIYNAVHVNTPDKSPEQTRCEYALEDKRVLLAGGRLVPWKRIELLLEMLTQRPEQEMLVLVGEGPCLETWKAQAASLGIGDRVRWVGRCSAARMASLYAIADVFLLPSLYEGLPHMPLEAAMYGCPSLVSQWGGNGEAAELCPQHVRVIGKDDPRTWAEALDTIARSWVDASANRLWTTDQQMQAYRALLLAESNR